jgi:hypothetical protein
LPSLRTTTPWAWSSRLVGPRSKNTTDLPLAPKLLSGAPSTARSFAIAKSVSPGSVRWVQPATTMLS